MENVFITGGAGFIGSHLVQYHLNKGDKVWVVDNLLSVSTENLSPMLSHPSMRFDQADIRTFPQLLEAVQWSDRIYHMAAIVGMYNVLSHPVETMETNILGLDTVLQAMHKAKKQTRLLVASSSAVYWNGQLGADGAFHEDAVLKVPSGAFLKQSYSFSKLVNEVNALAYSHEYGLHCTVVRLFNTVGTRQTGRYGMVIPTFIGQALRDEPLTVFGTGQQIRCFCNVHDATCALDLLVSNSKSKGEIFNVGNDQECTILELAQMIKERTNPSLKMRFVSYKEAYGMDYQDVPKNRPNIDKLHRLTGFRPQWTLEQTIDEILASKR